MKDGSGVFWTGMEKVFLQGVGFAQGVLLARLLTPHDFGLVAMPGLAVLGLFAEEIVRFVLGEAAVDCIVVRRTLR